MRTLQSLPTEILQEIAKTLEGEDRSGLLSLCLVSRQLCAIAQPFLYRAIHIETSNAAPLMPLLVRTLSENRKLAQKVKRLRFYDAVYPGPFRYWPWHMPAAEAAQRLAYQARRRLARTNRVLDRQGIILEYIRRIDAGGHNSEGMQLLREGLWKVLDYSMASGFQGAIAGLLLTLTPKLENVNMWDWYTWLIETESPLSDLFGLNLVYTVDEESFMNQVAALSPVMRGIRNVKALKLRSFDISFLNLPFESLRQLEIDLRNHSALRGATSDPVIMDVEHVYRKFPSLSSLKILGYVGDLTAYGVPELISDFLGNKKLACRNLEKLSIEMMRLPYGADPEFSGSFQHLAKMLIPVSHSLRHLQIDANDRVDLSVIDSFDPALSLQHLFNLRNLEVVQRMILPRGYPCRQTRYGIERFLPYILEELCIISPDEHVLEWLEGIERRKFPFLKVVKLHCRRDWGRPASWFRGPHSVLLALARDGVEVRIAQDDTRPDSRIWIGSWSDDDWRTPLFGEDF